MSWEKYPTVDKVKLEKSSFEEGSKIEKIAKSRFQFNFYTFKSSQTITS